MSINTYHIPTEVLYTDFVGPKYIVATDDPQFKQKHPELAGMCEEHYEELEPGEITEKKPFGLDNRIYKPNFDK